MYKVCLLNTVTLFLLLVGCAPSKVCTFEPALIIHPISGVIYLTKKKVCRKVATVSITSFTVTVPAGA